jgi:flagellar protein FliS
MSAQHSNYLESKVLTSPPHRLHLMLIEGALRFGRQADEALRRGDRTAASAPMLRVMDIVGEMLAGVRGQKSAVNTRLSELYWFLFRLVSEAKLESDGEKLAAAMRLLEYERQTWQMACDKVGGGSRPPATTSPSGFTLDA